MNIPALMFDEGGWCKALEMSYAPGRYQPASVEEFHALAPFARQPVPELVEDVPPNAPEHGIDDGIFEAVPETEPEPVAEKTASVAPVAPRKPRRK